MQSTNNFDLTNVKQEPKVISIHASLEIGPDGNLIGLKVGALAKTPALFVSNFPLTCSTCKGCLEINLVVHETPSQEKNSFLAVHQNVGLPADGGTEVRIKTENVSVIKEEPIDLMDDLPLAISMDKADEREAFQQQNDVFGPRVG